MPRYAYLHGLGRFVAMALLLLASAAQAGERVLQWAYSLYNPTATVQEPVELLIPAPYPRLAYQQRQALTISHPYTTSTDAYGNEVLRIQVGKLTPYARTRVRIRTILTSPRDQMPAGKPQAFLGVAKHMELNDERLRELAARLKADKPAATVRKIYDWVVQNLQVQDYNPTDLGAAAALTAQAGDCTEFAYLVTALARLNGIPARVVEGYLLTEQAKVQAADYHAWAEYYADGRWHLVDAHQRVLDTPAEGRYLGLRILADDATPTVAGLRFRALPDSIKVEME